MAEDGLKVFVLYNLSLEDEDVLFVTDRFASTQIQLIIYWDINGRRWCLSNEEFEY